MERRFNAPHMADPDRPLSARVRDRAGAERAAGGGLRVRDRRIRVLLDRTELARRRRIILECPCRAEK